MASETPLVVAAVRQLPGVLDAEVDRDPAGRVAAVRVRLAPGAEWADVEPAVQRLVRAGDPSASAVRVSLLEDDPAASGPIPAQHGSGPMLLPGRPRVSRLDISTAGLQVAVAVQLDVGQRTLVGRCSAALSDTGLPRAVATATMHALQELLGDAAQLALEHVEITRGVAGPLALVQLSLVRPGGAQVLAGSALVRHDPGDAVVRAVLDASNRRVEALLSA